MAIGLLVLTVTGVTVALLLREPAPPPLLPPVQSSGAVSVALEMRA